MNFHRFLFCLFSLLLLSGALPREARAVSDDWEAAPLTGENSFEETFTPTGFTTQQGEPVHGANTPATSLSGWWQWRAPTNGMLVIELTADTQNYGVCTAVYSSPGTWTPHGRANSMFANDPANSNRRVAKLTVQVVKDRLYYIAAAARTAVVPNPVASTTMAWDFVPYIPNSFVSVFEGTEQMRLGMMRLRTAKSASWSGSLEIGGRRYPMRGGIGAGGKGLAVVPLRRLPGTPAESPVVVELDFRHQEKLRILADLTFAVGRIAFSLPQVIRSSAANPSPWRGRYVTYASENFQPHSDWPALLDVKVNGSFRLVTFLSDRTRVVSSGFLCDDFGPTGVLYGYKSLYGGRGFWGAGIVVDPSTTPALVQGVMLAQRPPQPGRALLPEGYFAIGTVRGEQYFPPSPTEWVHSSFGLSGGDVGFFFTAEPGAPAPGFAPFDQGATLLLNGKFLFPGPNPSNLRAKFDRKTGMITGSYRSMVNPGRLVPIRLIYGSNIPGIGPGFTGFLTERHTPGLVQMRAD